jgi:gamma-glutamylcyclotransferase (GGCT)/AIG2-like uncharacterized protein YtfP
MDAGADISAVFVYGTLKRGQCRQWCWPRRPLAIERAWTPGRLVDLGPYPALVEGSDRVLGELWQFAPEDMPATLRALDDVEGFRGGAGDLYVRVRVECTTESGKVVRAYAYRYARALSAEAQPVIADARGMVEWRGTGAEPTCSQGQS